MEVVDQLGRVLAAMPEAEVRRQQLCHRSVVILLYDEAGRLLLRKGANLRGQGPVRWDLPAHSPVFQGEALLDAASTSSPWRGQRAAAPSASWAKTTPISSVQRNCAAC